MITSPNVAANRRRPTGIGKTLVDVRTLSRNCFESILTETLSLDTFSVVHAVEVRFAEGGNVGLKDIIVRNGERRIKRRNDKAIKIAVVTCSQATVGLGLALYPGGQTQL